MGLLLCFQWGSGGHAEDLYRLQEPAGCRTHGQSQPRAQPRWPLPWEHPVPAACSWSKRPHPETPIKFLPLLTA